MKRLILVLAFFLGACSQAVPQSQPGIQDETAVDSTQPSGPSVQVSTPQLEVLQPAAALLPGPVTLVALGDSLTQGDGDDSGRGYPGRLLDMVNAVRPQSTLVNLGQSGWSSDALINGDQGMESQLTRAVAEVTSAASQGRNPVALAGSAVMTCGISMNTAKARRKMTKLMLIVSLPTWIRSLAN